MDRTGSIRVAVLAPVCRPRPLRSVVLAHLERRKSSRYQVVSEIRRKVVALPDPIIFKRKPIDDVIGLPQDPHEHAVN